MLGFLSISWVIMPFLGGIMLKSYSYSYVLYISSIIFGLSLILSFYLKSKLLPKKRFKLDINIFENIKFFFSNKHLVYSFLLKAPVSFWYTFVFVFIPIYIIKSGFGKEYIGYMVALTQIPLIFIDFKLEYFLKKLGFKKILIISYLGLAILTFSYYFYQNIYFLLFIFFLTGFFAAFIENLPEIYYFRNVTKEQEEKTYTIFMNGSVIAAIFTNLFLGLILLFLDIANLFIIIPIILFLYFLLSLKVKNIEN